jgi:hypothetical protein
VVGKLRGLTDISSFVPTEREADLLLLLARVSANFTRSAISIGSSTQDSPMVAAFAGLFVGMSKAGI